MIPTNDSDPTLNTVTAEAKEFIVDSSKPKAGSGEHPAVKALHGALHDYARESEEESRAVRARVSKRLRSGSNRPHNG